MESELDKWEAEEAERENKVKRYFILKGLITQDEYNRILEEEWEKECLEEYIEMELEKENRQEYEEIKKKIGR